jgi:ribose transport system substrate-binding protein
MMRLGYRFAGVIGAAIVAVMVAGCPKEKPADSPPAVSEMGGSAARGERKNYKIAVIPKGTKHQFWQSVNAGAQAAAKEEGVTADWGGPANEASINDQVNLVYNKITAGVDGIVLAATEKKALVKPVKDAMAKNIPVVIVDSGIEEPDAAVAYIATDNVGGGRAAAETLAKAIGEKGNVGLIIFMKGSGSSDDREKGFKEGIAKYPGIKLVAMLEANDPQKGGEATTNMLTAHPDIVGIFAANEPNGLGSANAIKQLGKTGKVKLVAYDSSDEEIKAINDGVMYATVVQDPYQMGYKGVKTVLKAIRKEPIGEKTIDSGFKVVTKENLNTPEIQKLVNPTGKKQ